MTGDSPGQGTGVNRVARAAHGGMPESAVTVTSPAAQTARPVSVGCPYSAVLTRFMAASTPRVAISSTASAATSAAISSPSRSADAGRFST